MSLLDAIHRGDLAAANDRLRDGADTNARAPDDRTALMLDNITLYWLAATATSSARIYWQSMTNWKEHEIHVPVGYSQFPRDIHETSRRWVEQRYPTLVHYSEMPKRGHFAAWEQPEPFVDEVHASFRHSRVDGALVEVTAQPGTDARVRAA